MHPAIYAAGLCLALFVGYVMRGWIDGWNREVTLRIHREITSGPKPDVFTIISADSGERIRLAEAAKPHSVDIVEKLTQGQDCGFESAILDWISRNCVTHRKLGIAPQEELEKLKRRFGASEREVCDVFCLLGPDCNCKHHQLCRAKTTHFKDECADSPPRS